MIYERAIKDDGSLFFPERLTHEFLDAVKRTMGSYLFANQYLNEVFPSEEQVFRPEWIRYYSQLPEITYSFAFIDPAISTMDGADYTAVSVVKVDINQVWYLVHTMRRRINPTEIVNLVFDIQKEFNCQCIGIEDIAYQKALLYMLDEEMRRRGELLPVKGINPGTDKSKEMRILGLVPRFEWGRILCNQGMQEFETELLQFPRGTHDDMIDSLSSLESIVYYPTKKKEDLHEKPHSPQSSGYESWYIRNQGGRQQSDNDEF